MNATAPEIVADAEKAIRMALQHIRICAPDPTVEAALESIQLPAATQPAAPETTNSTEISSKLVVGNTAAPGMGDACEAAFLEAMVGRLYGREETRDAKAWFTKGWEAKPLVVHGDDGQYRVVGDAITPEAALAAQPAPGVGGIVAARLYNVLKTLDERGHTDATWDNAKRVMADYEATTRPAESVAQQITGVDDGTRYRLQADGTLAESVAQGGEDLSLVQFQDTSGNWFAFMSEKHRDDTIADGRWPIRYLSVRTPTPATGSGGEVSELRLVAKRNLRSMIECGRDDKKLMLTCLEELS